VAINLCVFCSGRTAYLFAELCQLLCYYFPENEINSTLKYSIFCSYSCSIYVLYFVIYIGCEHVRFELLAMLKADVQSCFFFCLYITAVACCNSGWSLPHVDLPPVAVRMCGSAGGNRIAGNMGRGVSGDAGDDWGSPKFSWGFASVLHPKEPNKP
jgi:hypothetical protein